MAKLIHKIMMHTQSLLRCERCQVLLVDDTTKVSTPLVGKIREAKGVWGQGEKDSDCLCTCSGQGNQAARTCLEAGVPECTSVG